MPATPSRSSRHGKHLLLEKPGAINTAGHELISAAAARRPDLTVRVAYHRRHDPGFRELARRVAAGDIGEPFAVHMRSSEDFPPSDADRFAGGFVMDVGVHDFDTARWLLSRDPTSAYAVGRAARIRQRRQFLDHRGLRSARVATTELSRTSTQRHGHPLRGGRQRGLGAAHRGAAGERADDPRRRRPTPLSARLPRGIRRRLPQRARPISPSSCRGHEAPGATLLDDRHAVATAVAARASVPAGTPLAIGPDWEWPGG